jgi:heme d1 biosynthesis radical SAM protein NirJ
MQALGPTPPPERVGKPAGPVVIWNLVRRCNLTCKHCYSISADIDFPGELNTEQVFEVMDDLKQYGVPVLILSGGEPLLRPDIFEVSKHAKAMGFYTALSTNGTLIDEHNIDQIAAMNYDYLGISIDGLRETHDRFRRKQGAFDEAMRGIRLSRDRGIKVGLRFTVTRDNAHDLPGMLNLMNEEKIDKFYLSHLNYAGRGDKNRKDDAAEKMTRDVMDQLFSAAWKAQQNQTGQEFVTGNNDADGVYFLQWVRRNFPDKAKNIQRRLVQWGGNSSGVNISNIDNLGNVHPDTMWWNYNLGNVKQRPFSEIWSDTSDPLMAGLKQTPRPLKGRCRVCNYRDICGGNTRTRAFQISDDPWWQDPGCYLSDDELSIKPADYAEDRPNTGQLQRRRVRRAS